MGQADQAEQVGVYDPRSRLTGMRKYLYILSAVNAAHHLGMINYPAVTKLTGGLLTLPPMIAGYALAGALAILLVRYAVSGSQFVAIYLNSLRSRLDASSGEAVARAQHLVLSNKSNLADAERKSEEHKRSRLVVEMALARLEQRSDAAPLRSQNDYDVLCFDADRFLAGVRGTDDAGTLKNLQSHITTLDKFEAENRIERLRHKKTTEESVQLLESLKRQVPELSRSYAAMEILLDILAFGLPPAFAVVSLFNPVVVAALQWASTALHGAQP